MNAAIPIATLLTTVYFAPGPAMLGLPTAGASWIPLDSYEQKCDESLAGCEWIFDSGISSAGIPKPENWSEVQYTGVIIQKVSRHPDFHDCGSGPLQFSDVEYYEWMPVAHHMKTPDSLSSGIISHDMYGTEWVVGESKWIPLNATTEPLLRELKNDIDANWNGEEEVPDEGGDPAILVKDPNGGHICSGDATIHSGGYWNSDLPPMSLDATINWNNNYGGLAESLPTRILFFGSNCCDYPGATTHRCIR